MTEAERLRRKLAEALDYYKEKVKVLSRKAEDFIDELPVMYYQTLTEDLQAALDGKCPETPEAWTNTPLGQYHCPRCGCMCVAGMRHLHDENCYLGLGSDSSQRQSDDAAETVG